jgi:hypothetical protein
MLASVRRGGVGVRPGRALIQAGVFCLVAAGCATDPPPALLTLIDPETMTLQDSELLPDSAKAAIRTYLGQVQDSIWLEVSNPEMASLVGECRGLTALFNPVALPAPGRTASVAVDVPGTGLVEFRVAHVGTEGETAATATYTGQAKRGAMSLLLLRDTVVAGRINTDSGTYNFKSGLFGFINVAPADTSGSLPELHLIRTTAAIQPQTRYSQGAQC